MLDVIIDAKQFQKEIKDLPDASRAALVSVMRSEAFRVGGILKSYAKSGGEGWPKEAPITKALRRGRGYGAWFARWTRYFVDPVQLTAYAGIIAKGDVDMAAARFQPVSKQFGDTAKRIARGYKFTQTKRRQREQAALLTAKYKSAKGQARVIKLIPRIGPHFVKPRPVVYPIFQRERARSVRNIERLWKIKLEGRRYSKDWAVEWGNL